MNNYKSSNYNIFIDKLSENKSLIFNSYFDSYVVLDEQHMDALNNISICDDEKIIADLSSQGLIIKKDFYELNNILINERINKYRDGTLILTIAPSMECNMDCPYCYESRKRGVMSLETEEKLFNWIENIIKNGNFKSLSVTWYGGEPLLKIDTIERLSNKLIPLCADEKINYFSSIVTNGILLNRENSVILKNCKIQFVQVTIDGLKDEHNKRRLLKSNGDSFTTIINNIKENCDIININVRSNIDKENIDEIDKLIDYLFIEQGLMNKIGLYFAPVTDITKGCLFSDTCYSFKEFSEIENYASQRIYDVTRDMKYLFYPSRRVMSCGAVSLNYFVIDHMGNLYKCWNNICVEDKIVGNINDKMNFINEENYKWLSYNLSDNDKCKECEYLPLCMGGCPYFPINGFGNQCDHRIYSCKNYLRLYYQNYLRQKESNYNLNRLITEEGPETIIKLPLSV
ncbi:MAG: SPASM domain-containing protein [Oscillospiraceae bacterium]|nr:SPASM domain-containing protein [Oscillospiraceae bacterium]